MISYTKIKKYVNSGDYDYEEIPIKYTKQDSSTLNSFTINSQKSYNFYGSTHLSQKNNVYSYLKTISNSNDKIIKNTEIIIHKIINSVLEGFDTDCYWLAIRSFLKNKDYEIPRWHKDGTHLASIRTPQPKFALALKGAGTLFIENTKKNNDLYNKIQQKMASENYPKKPHTEYTKEDYDIYFKIEKKYRKIFATKFKSQSIIQIKPRNGVVFFGGVDSDKSAIHSEPNMEEDRLFISILPLTKESLILMKEKYEKK